MALKEVKNILKPQGELDVLYYYSQVSRVLEKFLAGREIATKTVLKDFTFLKRGSNSPVLFIEDLRAVNNNMLELRKGHLDEVKDKLIEKKILIWQYFVPRKMVNFFYACNGERQGKLIDRIFIDIDRQNYSQDDARKVCLELVKIIKQDKEFNNLLKFKIFLMWTGSSFHIYLLLGKKINLNFYKKYLSYGKNKNESFIMKWAAQISEKIKINVKAGHEREKRAIILDSSNTPSGKLARAPFSLHVSGYNKYDGIALPVSEQQLGDKNLIKKLKRISPEEVLKSLNKYSKLL